MEQRKTEDYGNTYKKAQMEMDWPYPPHMPRCHRKRNAGLEPSGNPQEGKTVERLEEVGVGLGWKTWNEAAAREDGGGLLRPFAFSESYRDR